MSSPEERGPLLPCFTYPFTANIPPDCPPGLAYLLGVSSIVIEQEKDFNEINSKNKYDIYDRWERRLYVAKEDSGECALMCGGWCRPWKIKILDSTGQPVMLGQRDSTCIGLCANSVQVKSAYGQPLGGIVQNCETWSTSWDIVDWTGVSVLTLGAPCCSVPCPCCATCCTAEFPLRTKSGEQVGAIFKKFGKWYDEICSNADTFNVNFPADLDVTVKATLIFATFMVDFMYYEDNLCGGSGRGYHRHYY